MRVDNLFIDRSIIYIIRFEYNLKPVLTRYERGKIRLFKLSAKPII